MQAIGVRSISGYTWDQVGDSLDKVMRQERGLRVTHLYDPTHNGDKDPWDGTFADRELGFEPTHLVFTYYKRSRLVGLPRFYLIRAEPIL